MSTFVASGTVYTLSNGLYKKVRTIPHLRFCRNAHVPGEYSYYSRNTGEWSFSSLPRYERQNERRKFGQAYHRPYHRFVLPIDPVMSHLFDRPKVTR